MERRPKEDRVLTTERLCRTIALAGSLFPSTVTLRSLGGGKCSITGATRSGKMGTMTIDGGGAFAFDGDLDDMIAATLAASGRAGNG